MSAILTTDRLVLRAFRPDDADAIVHGVGSYPVARYLSVVPHPYDRQMALDWMATLPAPNPREAALAVELPGKGVIGCVHLSRMLGYWIAQPFWGQGFVTEASRALIAWHFAETASAQVLCCAHWDNRASRRVQRKLGFVECGREPRFVASQKRYIDHIDTMLTREAHEGRR